MKKLFAMLIFFGMAVMPAFPAPADQDDKRFDPGPASSYTTRQTNGKVTVTAVPYTSDEQASAPFGKHNPYQYGILPVLVIIQNNMDEPLRMTGIQTEFITARGQHLDAIPPQELASTIAKHPRDGASIPGQGGPRLPVRLPKKKNPLADSVFEARAFRAQMLPPHESAYGFFYFQARLTPGAHFFLSGLQAARSGEGIIYFEFPLDEKQAP